MSASVVQWICRELSRLLGFEATEDIAKYILAIDTKKDLEEYMCELLDPSVPRNKKFIDDLSKKWRPPVRQADGYIPDNMQVYRKSDDDLIYSSKSEKKTKKKGKKSTQSDSSPTFVPQEEKSPSPENGAVPQKSTGAIPKGTVPKKNKFTPLFSEDGHLKTAAKLPGRHSCDCQASKHSLINNCVKCGRVVCEQEGSGPCLFCGNLVCSKEEQEVLDRGSKKSDKLRNQLMSVGGGQRELLPSVTAKLREGQEAATKHKDKLLEYDRTSVKRTQVIDDESDYFTTEGNTWLSKTEKDSLRKREEELRSIRHASRKDRKITLDFAGRQVVEDKSSVDMYNVKDSVVQQVHYGAKSGSQANTQPDFTEDDFGHLVNPGITMAPPQFVAPAVSYSEKAGKSVPSGGEEKKKSLRIQDRELQEMSDEGVCLSMHQPWASLLVAGIKKHEGRSWYSAHRGRLWIAATAKSPAPQEIAEVEYQYRHHYNDADIEFPRQYPVGCLLGCVDMVDCLPAEDYHQKFPDGESGSPNVFICESPQELVVKFPIKGRHKIYKLDGHTHQAAKKGLRKVTIGE